MTSIVLCVLALSGPAPDIRPAPAPLTERQLARLQELVRTTQQRDLELSLRLEGKQQELVAQYALFELSDDAIRALKAEILDLQEQILVNYHELQVGLRRIVGQERFRILKDRIDLMLKKQRSQTAKPSEQKGSL